MTDRTAFAVLATLHNIEILPKTVGREYVVGYVDHEEVFCPVIYAYDRICKLSPVNPKTAYGKTCELLAETAVLSCLCLYQPRSPSKALLSYLDRVKTRLRADLSVLRRTETCRFGPKSVQFLTQLTEDLGVKIDPFTKFSPFRFFKTLISKLSSNSIYILKGENFENSAPKSKSVKRLAPKTTPKKGQNHESFAPNLSDYNELGKHPVLKSRTAPLLDLRIMLNEALSALGAAYQSVYGPYARFRYTWDTCPAGLREFIRSLAYMGDEYPQLELYDILSGAFAYYSRTHHGKAPPQFLLGAWQFREILERICQAKLQLRWWEANHFSEKDPEFAAFRTWCQIVVNQARTMYLSEDPLTEGGASMLEYNRWVLLKAWASYLHAKEECERRYNLRMTPASFLAANMLHIRQYNRRTFDDLYGEQAKLRAYSYMRIFESKAVATITETVGAESQSIH